MGRAIVRKPQVFLMDEPLSNLDAKLRDTEYGQPEYRQPQSRTCLPTPVRCATRSTVTLR
jgi:ABC-type sugar transport system ATPase subunit